MPITHKDILVFHDLFPRLGILQRNLLDPRKGEITKIAKIIYMKNPPTQQRYGERPLLGGRHLLTIALEEPKCKKRIVPLAPL